MKVTFLIGNGFDISMGLKTSYRDFKDWYCDQPCDDATIIAFKKHIKDDMLTNGEYWSDFEKGLGQYTTEFTLETVQDFIKCYNDARTKLLEYIRLEEARIDSETINQELQGFVNGLSAYYSELRPKEKIQIENIYPTGMNDNIEINFITYNYTSVLDKYVSKYGKNAIHTWRASGIDRRMFMNRIIHIHGTMTEYPIFGVNDETQIANQELLKNQQFRSIMIKSESINEISVLWYDDAEQMIMNSNIICLYGMSMGITDARWFSSLMKWLKSSQNHFLIDYCYNKNPSNMISINRWSELKDEERKKLASYSKYTETELTSIIPRIFIIENTKKVFVRKKEE
ncbi:hypothetical protein JRC49_01805 [Clostridiales bacterium FE2011]|nr:hypothetical protein JRC49_01805 [Clostridiales bacterium FE2011]